MTEQMLAAITGQSERLADNPLLARSIKNRFPYLDPLNHLQVELLKRFRSGKAGSDDARGDSRNRNLFRAAGGGWVTPAGRP